MRDLIETVKHRGFDINIYPDDNPEDPREWDNLGTMVCFHRNYSLGDKHDFDSVEEMWVSLAEDAGFDVEELEEREMAEIEKIVYENYTVLPLYLFDHSGITMSTRPFSCPWDSGQVGIIYVSNEKAKKELENYKGKTNAVDILVGEVETYDKYIRGDIYGYMVEPSHRNKSIDCDDSCWGYYELEDMIEEAKDNINYSIKEYKKEMVKQHKERMATNLFLRTCWAD